MEINNKVFEPVKHAVTSYQGSRMNGMKHRSREGQCESRLKFSRLFIIESLKFRCTLYNRNLPYRIFVNNLYDTQYKLQST